MGYGNCQIQQLIFNYWEKQNCEVFLIDVEKNIVLVTIITMNRNILVVTTSVYTKAGGCDSLQATNTVHTLK